jgi:Ca2+-binding EF-hand superfamily protein
MSPQKGIFLLCNLFLLVLVAFSLTAKPEAPVHNKNDNDVSSTEEKHDPLNVPQDDTPKHGGLHEDDSHHDAEGQHKDDYDHEAVLGSHEEAQEYQDLSVEESTRRLGLLVDKMDLDKDGAVNKTELHEWIVHSFKNLDQEKAKSKVEAQDESGDGKVTWPEYLHRKYGYTESEVERFRRDNNSDSVKFVENLNDEVQRFSLADVNHDGFLDTEEYVAFHFPHHFLHMAPYEVRQALHDFDTDKDGLIDDKEFLGTGKYDVATLEAEKKRFAEFDTNKDGKLDKEELLPWIMPGYNKIANEEVEHLFKETDEDKNDVLSKDEILKQHDLWVGSHATDQGSHLETVDESEVKTEL